MAIPLSENATVAHASKPYEVDDGEGGTITVMPPERFGVMA